MTERLKKIFIEKPVIPIIILGGILRLGYLLFYLNDPQWNQLLVDSLFHDRWAQSIAGGNILGREAFFRAPLYIYLLGGIYAVFGHALLIARILGNICGLVAVFVTWKISVRLFSKKAAVAASLIHALYPIAVYFESELLVDSFFTLLVELSIWFFLKALDTRNIKTFIVSGLFIGLAAITRPVILALIPLYLLWIWLSAENHLNAFQIIGLMISIIIIVISPVTIRNLIVADDLVLVSSSGGINFYIGNNENAEGYSAAMPPPAGHNWRIKDIEYLAEKEANRNLKASEISRFWYNKGFQWIIHNKADFIKLYFFRLYLLMNNLEISNNRNLPLFFSSNPFLKFNPLNFGLIISLAIMGLAFLFFKRRLNGPRLFLILFSVLYILIISLFFINARFRLPVIPLFIILSGYGLTALFESTKKKVLSYTTVIPIILGFGMYMLAHGDVSKIGKNDITSGLFNQANYYLYFNNMDRAIDLYAEVLSVNPGYPDANLNLGAAYLKKGVGDSAEYYFRRELSVSENNAEAWSNLASLYYIKKIYDSAALYADSALSARPYLIDAYLIKMRILSAQNNLRALEQTIHQALYYNEDNPEINLEAGIIYSNHQDFGRAQKYLTAVPKAAPPAVETDDNAFNYSNAAGGDHLRNLQYEALSQLGYIYGIQGRLDSSIEMSRRAVEIDSSKSRAYINLINALRLQGEREKAFAVLAIARARFPNDSIVAGISRIMK